MKRLVVVGGLISAAGAPDGRFLVARRPRGTHLAGHWEFPGGKVEPGEPPDDALRRELLEELGVDVEVGDIFAVGHDLQAEREVLLLVYRCVLRGGTPQCLQVAEWRWMTVAELATLDLPPADRPAMARLRREVGTT